MYIFLALRFAVARCSSPTFFAQSVVLIAKTTFISDHISDLMTIGCTKQQCKDLIQSFTSFANPFHYPLHHRLYSHAY